MKNYIEYFINQFPKFQILSFEITGKGIIEPDILKDLRLPAGIDFKKGVIISGKGPVWFYAGLVHLLHIAKWVAIYDPRLGAIVVQNHSVDPPAAGDIIPVEEFSEFLKH